MKTTFAMLRRELRPLLAVTVSLLALTTVAYPGVVTAVGQSLFNRQANGSMLEVNGSAVGSSLLGQAFGHPGYFQPRPSAAGAGYDGASSSGSNLGPTSDKLINGVADDGTTADVDESFAGLRQRAAAYRELNGLPDGAILPSDAITSSGSGLDPHISPANALAQAARVARARGIDEGEVLALIEQWVEKPSFGFIGVERVNVLKLNIELNERFPLPE